MGNVKVEINYKGIGNLLKSEAVEEMLNTIASQIQQRAGAEYTHDIKRLPTRKVSAVFTTSDKGAQDNMDHNTLLKAVGK